MKSPRVPVELKVLAVALGLMTVSFWFANLMAAKACDALWPDRNHEFQLFWGCLVEYDGNMVPQERLLRWGADK